MTRPGLNRPSLLSQSLTPLGNVTINSEKSQMFAFGVLTLGDARSFSGLTSKIPPLGSMINFDADVKNTTVRHQCENPNCLC